MNPVASMNNNPKHVSWLHRVATLVAVGAFASVVLGTLIASNLALPASSVPGAAEEFTWSLLSGGVQHEPAYRIVAATAALLATVVAFWLLPGNAARHVKILGVINASAASANVWLSDIPAKLDLPSSALAAHAGVSELFFGLSVCLALFTRTDWHWDMPKVVDVAAPSFRQLLVFTTAWVFVSSVLGTQTHPSMFPHLLSGCAVTLAALWTVEIALNRFADVPALKIPGILLAELAGVQLCLGIVAHSMALNARANSQPMPGLAVINATHAALGALVLAASLFATFQAFKYLTPKSAIAAVPVAAETEADAYYPK
jgi:heme A synthase